jgi:N-acetyl-anhydromuramyl-L-alanine amidase AmpD
MSIISQHIQIPFKWLPEARMKRVICHWTAGTYTPSALDKEHYHFLISGLGEVVRGLHPITDNEAIGSKSQDEYAAHTRGCNTGSIGISMCGGAGSTEMPYNPGAFPITERQWQALAEATAALCRAYGIPVTDKTVLTHAEVQQNLGIRQNGKWDIARLSFGKGLTSAKACGDDLRARVRKVL